MKVINKTLALSALCCANIGHASAAPDPTIAESPTPATHYISPFKDYRSLGDDKRVPWRAANDEVGKIGGWRVYLRESLREPQEANKAAPSASTSVPEKSPAPNKPKTSEHAGHGQHQ